MHVSLETSVSALMCCIYRGMCCISRAKSWGKHCVSHILQAAATSTYQTSKHHSSTCDSTKDHRSKYHSTKYDIRQNHSIAYITAAYIGTVIMT